MLLLVVIYCLIYAKKEELDRERADKCISTESNPLIFANPFSLTSPR